MKKTRAETICTFLRGTTFVVCSIEDNENLTTFLASVPGGFQSIRGQRFDYFGRLPPDMTQNMDLELAVLCVGLLELKLAMHNDVLVSRSVEAAWTYYKLDRLLDCGRLTKVTIQAMGYYIEAAADQAARGLATLIKNGFDGCGRTVIVDIK